MFNLMKLFDDAACTVDIEMRLLLCGSVSGKVEYDEYCGFHFNPFMLDFFALLVFVKTENKIVYLVFGVHTFLVQTLESVRLLSCKRSLLCVKNAWF